MNGEQLVEPGQSHPAECRLDAEAFSPCTSPFSRAGLAQGMHNFAVRATDFSGNAGTPASRDWTIAAPAEPLLSLTAKRRQRPRRIRVEVGCGAVACAVELGGKAKLAKVGRLVHASAGKRPRTFKLKPADVAIGAGERQAAGHEAAGAGGDHHARIEMTVEIRDVKHLEKVIKSIKGVDGVIGVERTARA